MKRENLYKLCLVWFIVIIISSCGQNVQKDDKLPDNEYIPTNEVAKTYLQLGIEYMRRGKNDIALGRLQDALKVDQNYADAHNAIAILYERVGLDDKAKQHYLKAINLKPNGSDIHNNYGQFLCRHKQWQEANVHFLKALENPVYSAPEIPYTNAGLCALRSKDTQKAETYFRTALQKNSKFPRALFQMANLSYEQKRYLQARDYLQRYLLIAKHTPQTLWLGIRIERVLDNKNMEAKYILLLRKDFPDALETQSLNRERGHWGR